MKPNDDLFVVVFECCRMVKGHSRTLFCDIQRKAYRFIPNDLAEMLLGAKGKSIRDIKKFYDNKYDQIIEENLNLLEQKEFVFFTDHPEWFPLMSLEWDEPTALTNAIVDIDLENMHDFKKIWKQFSELGCEHIQIRSYKNLDLKALSSIIDEIQALRIISLELIISFDANMSTQEYVDFVFQYPRIFSLILHSAKEDKQVYLSPTNMGNVFYSKSQIKNNMHCGQVSPEFFNIHIKSFTESQHHNSCLNRKISIDVHGNIKNCPSMPESYGNIKDTTLREALEKPGFKKHWNITKDQIAVCKDCEFRYICTDCRAYLEDPEDIYSKPLKCGYNPYTCEWEEWSTHPLKQKGIKYYGMEELVKEG
ncbi:MAG: grasp-with-spasm system SPASM domain peptide maturase [Bacteroidetes bacterium]|nr:grasp-with-spasm system SPASM domain peptide maturase [Bacteroidota bacterium]